MYVSGKDGEAKAQDTLPNGLQITDTSNAVPDFRTKTYVIINKNTASAAEVLAAGLRENERAILVGEKSFGKGIIQNLQELTKGNRILSKPFYSCDPFLIFYFFFKWCELHSRMYY